MAWEPARLRGDDDLSAQLGQMAADYGQRLAQLGELKVQASRVTAVARTRDGLVTVMVGARGQLLRVELKQGVYQRMSPQRLGAAVVELSAAATRDAAEQVREIMRSVLPAGWGPGGDLAGIVPPGLSLLDGGVASGRW